VKLDGENVASVDVVGGRSRARGAVYSGQRGREIGPRDFRLEVGNPSLTKPELVAAYAEQKARLNLRTAPIAAAPGQLAFEF